MRIKQENPGPVRNLRSVLVQVVVWRLAITRFDLVRGSGGGVLFRPADGTRMDRNWSLLLFSLVFFLLRMVSAFLNSWISSRA